MLDKSHIYAVPTRLEVNYWALSGDWTVKKDAAAANKSGSAIAYRFHARDLHLVMGPPSPGTPVWFECGSMESRRAPHTETMSTIWAAASSASSGSIS